MVLGRGWGRGRGEVVVGVVGVLVTSDKWKVTNLHSATPTCELGISIRICGKKTLANLFVAADLFSTTMAAI